MYDVEIEFLCEATNKVIHIDHSFYTYQMVQPEIRYHEQPCDGQPFTLKLRYEGYDGSYHLGASSFEWTNEEGEVVSTDKEFKILSYNPSYNGVYKVKVIYDGCIELVSKSIEVNSKFCGGYAKEVCQRPPASGTAPGTNVGISTQQTQNSGWPQTIPNGFIALESKEKGFVITRVQNSDLIAEPKDGMLIYDIDDACVELYYGKRWACVKRGCGESIIVIPN